MADTLYRWARTGNRLVNGVAMVVLAILLMYGSFSLWDTYWLERGGLSSELMKYKPQGGDIYSFLELQRINPDVIAWLTIDGTDIDQPVTRSEKDDMEYVNKNALGDFSLTGSVFLSCHNDKSFSDPYNLTYGHHIGNGAMYGDLEKFLESRYFKGHRTGTLFTPEKTYAIELFAVVSTDAYNGIVYNPYNYSSGSFEQLQSYLKEEAAQSRKISLKQGDQVIALTTCYDATSNGRIALFGKMTEMEKEEVGDKQWEN